MQAEIFKALVKKVIQTHSQSGKLHGFLFSFENYKSMYNRDIKNSVRKTNLDTFPIRQTRLIFLWLTHLLSSSWSPQSWCRSSPCGSWTFLPRTRCRIGSGNHRNATRLWMIITKKYNLKLHLFLGNGTDPKLILKMVKM
jgi:hypothetical protein